MCKIAWQVMPAYSVKFIWVKAYFNLHNVYIKKTLNWQKTSRLNTTRYLLVVLTYNNCGFCGDPSSDCITKWKFVTQPTFQQAAADLYMRHTVERHRPVPELDQLIRRWCCSLKGSSQATKKILKATSLLTRSPYRVPHFAIFW